MNLKIKLGLAAAGATACALTLAGCGNKATQYWNDSPRSPKVNDAPAQVIAMPDGFNNAATKCDNGNRLYVSFHGDSSYAAIAVVPHDPTCVGQ